MADDHSNPPSQDHVRLGANATVCEMARAAASRCSWIPDWKDERAYPKELTPKYWAWEFLRRNAEYQADYLVFSKLPDTEDGHVTGKLKGQPWLGGRCDYFYCDPPALPGELFQDYGVRTKNEYEVIPWADYLTRKWGLCPIHDPAESEPFAMGGDFGLEGPPYVFCLPTELQHFLDERLELGQQPIIFDVRHSIEAQLEEAKQLLVDLKESSRDWLDPVRASQVQSHKIYRTYLRLLDADLTETPHKEMAALIYPYKLNIYPDFSGRDSVRKALSAAEKLRDGGYKALLGK